jgi:CheY-like chemotaxis protein/anti-sigma regulatory factor (Ser/Thr protein kinase)
VATCGAPLPTKGDPARLAQVVGNLLTNAAKFTPGGGRVEVSVERDGDAAVIRVRDTGAGVEAGLLERLFDPFVQAEATLDRSKGGLGLGLSLVKGLVELHGGSVSAHSDGPGRGATFVVKLPVEDVPAAEVRPPRASSPGCGARTLRVLLIEDNADAAESLKEALAFGGHQVEIANTGFEGLAKVRGFGPDVVLCDLGLPGIDGFEVARRMRADPAVEAPLVALSGYAGPEDLERSREAGFARHVAKPPDLDELERVLCDVSSPAPDAHPDGP